MTNKCLHLTRLRLVQTRRSSKANRWELFMNLVEWWLNAFGGYWLLAIILISASVGYWAGVFVGYSEGKK